MINYLNLNIIEQNKQANILSNKSPSIKKTLLFLWHKKILTIDCQINKQGYSTLSFLTKGIKDNTLFFLIEKCILIENIKEILYKRDFQENNNQLIFTFENSSEKYFSILNKEIESTINFERSSILNESSQIYEFANNIIKLNKFNLTNLQKLYLNYAICSFQVKQKNNLFFISYLQNKSLLVNEKNFDNFVTIASDENSLKKRSKKFEPKRKDMSELIKSLKSQFINNL